VKRFKVEVLPQAEAEFREAFLWYFERSPLAADAFRTEVFDKIDDLEGDADTWPKDENGIHFRLLNRFPYTVHYDLLGIAVTVLAVAHQRRLPKYWVLRGTSTSGDSDA
jgi:plasmid stabilization system protein ParE